MMRKKPPTFGNQILPSKYGFGIGYGIGRKYRPIWVLVLVLDLIQNSGFSRMDYGLKIMIFVRASLENVSTHYVVRREDEATGL